MWERRAGEIEKAMTGTGMEQSMRDRDVKDEDKHTEPADAARELRAYEVRLPVVVLGLVALAGLIAFVLPPATWLATPLFCLAMFAAAFLIRASGWCAGFCPLPAIS